MITYNFGIVGLGVMGRNLLLNMADNGYAVAGLALDQEKAASVQAEAQEGPQIYATVKAEEFVLYNPCFRFWIREILSSMAETLILQIQTEDIKNFLQKESIFSEWESRAERVVREEDQV